jgi:hypothetical protein
MPITIPKPILLLPKVPSLLVVGLLAAQFFFFQIGHSPEPKCTLNVERPHHSTSLKEKRNIDAIKLNMTVTCNVPQKYSEIASSIQKIENNREVLAHKFQVIRRVPEIKSSNLVVIEDLYKECLFGVWSTYKGEAKGYAMLESGKKYPFEGDSGKYMAADCSIGAQ